MMATCIRGRSFFCPPGKCCSIVAAIDELDSAKLLSVELVRFQPALIETPETLELVTTFAYVALAEGKKYGAREVTRAKRQAKRDRSK